MRHRLKIACFGLIGGLLCLQPSAHLYGQIQKPNESQQKKLATGIQGTIKDPYGEPLEGVTVKIQGTSTGAYSDMNGAFSFELSQGTYNVQFSYVGFRDTVLSVKVLPNKLSKIELTFQEDGGLAMQGVEIVAVRQTNTEISVISDIKTMDKVANGISTQQIQKMPDRNASEIIRRIPGVTLQDNRFVLVRGLNERYNTIWLDRALTPSAETDKRAFAFDIIPSQVIERMMIYKTASADLPADFAGAFIQVSTHNIPSETALQVNYTTGYRTGTTFQTFQQSQQGSLDWMGIDDNTRALPSSLPNLISSNGDIDYYNRINQAFPNTWGHQARNAFLDHRLTFTYNHVLRSNKIKAGSVSVLSYSNTKQTLNINRKDYAVDGIQLFDFYDQQYLYNASTSLIHNWSFSFSPRFKMDFRNFFNQTGRDQTTIRNGQHFDMGSDVYGGMYYYLQKTTYTGQLSALHTFNKENQKLEYAVSYSLANRQEPDLRRFTSTRALNAPHDPFQVSVPQGTGSPTRAGRFYSNLNENIFTTTLHYNHPFTFNLFANNAKLQIKTGFYNEFRDRNFQARVFTYVIPSLSFDYDKLKLPIHQIFAPENMNLPTGFKISEMTLPSDKYYTRFLIMAGYLQANLSFNRWEITLGARAENTNRTLEGKNQDGQVVNINQSQLNILPSSNIVFKVNEKNLVRAAYSQTLNRPEYREMAPFIFYDYDLNATIIGNPNLHNATIQNYDLRYEYYPTPGDMISGGIFYKHFQSPIEWIIQPGSGNLNRTFTFANASKAYSAGAEMEIKKSLAAWTENSNTFSFLKYFSLLINASFIKNEVTIGEQLALNQQAKRAMQGQSPYILNTGIFFQSDSTTGIQASILYNIFGPRIFIVGDRDYADIYEMQRHVIDLSVSKSFGTKWSIKLNIQDLLNQPFRFVQDFNKDLKLQPLSNDKTLFSWKRGTYFSLGIQYKF